MRCVTGTLFELHKNQTTIVVDLAQTFLSIYPALEIATWKCLHLSNSPMENSQGLLHASAIVTPKYYFWFFIRLLDEGLLACSLESKTSHHEGLTKPKAEERDYCENHQLVPSSLEIQTTSYPYFLRHHTRRWPEGLAS